MHSLRLGITDSYRLKPVSSTMSRRDSCTFADKPVGMSPPSLVGAITKCGRSHYRTYTSTSTKPRILHVTSISSSNDTVPMIPIYIYRVAIIPTFSTHRRQHLSYCRHESFLADQLDITAGVPFSPGGQLLEVHLGEQLHVLRIQIALEQLLTCLEVRERDEDSLFQSS